MSAPAILDSTDMAILGFLTQNARISNREIAQKLNLAEGTVRSRIKRMIDEKSIRFTALTHELDVSTPTLCYVGLRVELPLMSEVAKALSALPEVRFVATTLGRYDIFMVVVVASAKALSELVSRQIMPIEGVRRAYTSIVTETLKYDHRWGKVG